MDDWSTFVSAVETGAAQAAKNLLSGFEAEASADAKSFIAQSETDLKTWTTELANKQISADDLKNFVQADVALAAMEALTQAGIAEADLQKLRDQLIDVVVNAATSTFLKV